MAGLSSRSKEIQNLRKLTKSQKRLSLMLFSAVFAMANFYGLSYLMDLHSSLSKEVEDLRGEERTNQVWLREKNLWLNRKQWIDHTQPRIRSNQIPQSELLESLTSSAAADHLEIQEQSFGANSSTQNYKSVAVRLKLSGSLQ